LSEEIGRAGGCFLFCVQSATLNVSMNFEIIFVAGPQGSGKGTQGRRLADKLGFFFWGMGGILREIQSKDVQFAQKLEVSNRGMLLPDELIIEIVQQRLAHVPTSQGIVFDGVPRRIGQAEFLVPFLRGRGYQAMATVFIDLPRAESIRRLSSRAQSEQRVDDTPDAIQRRFEYYDQTMPAVVEYLQRETKFVQVDGSPAVDDVEKSVDAALGI
jgi:adenylate kinase